jgi:hypothetical protein
VVTPERLARVIAVASTLLLAAPAAAERGSWDLGANVGVASPDVDGVQPGLAIAISARLGVSEQLSVELSGSQSMHSLEGDSTNRTPYRLTQAGLGAAIALDWAPIIPSLEAGGSAVWSSMSGQATTFGVWPYLGISLRARPWRRLDVSLGVRYWLGSQPDGNSQNYTQVVLGIGFGSRK